MADQASSQDYAALFSEEPCILWAKLEDEKERLEEEKKKQENTVFSSTLIYVLQLTITE